MSMNHDDSKELEFATVVASAAYAIHSLEEAETEFQKKIRYNRENSRTRNKSRKIDSARLSTTGISSRERLIRQDRKAPENDFPVRPISALRQTDTVPKTDAWEKTQKEKIKKRYERMKSKIVAWENEKKMQAKLHMEKKKGELEQRMAVNQLHYKSKITRIEQIAGGAKTQLEEKRRNEEHAAKESAKKIISKGRFPMKYLCF